MSISILRSSSAFVTSQTGFFRTKYLLAARQILKKASANYANYAKANFVRETEFSSGKHFTMDGFDKKYFVKLGKFAKFADGFPNGQAGRR